mmetsp:Transcript_5658/g.18123  ORF Transcript_5658/g.18123 Transcript_5658/m.18123 type:complete len:190 (-) Transcript_5658:143-712(-)
MDSSRECTVSQQLDDEQRPLALASLPTDALAHICSLLPAPEDLSCAERTSLHFQEAVVRALRARRYGLPALDTTCEPSWTQAALWEERRDRVPAQPIAVGFSHVTFVDDSGRLLSCGTEDFDAGVDRPGLLGHGEGVRRLAQPTRLPVTGQRVRFRSVSSGVAHTLAVSERGDVFAWGAPAPLRLLVDS